MSHLRKWRGSLVLLALVSGCDQTTEVSTTELAQVVARDGVAFTVESIPPEVSDRLASHKVVLVGETHLVREHRELMAEVIKDLHARGFRQLLLESAHMSDWLLTDFVEDGQLEPDWEPPFWAYGDLLTAIRDFNRSLPEGERVRVRAIDMNLQEYGGASSFRGSLGALSLHLANPGPIDEFLQGSYRTPEGQAEKLATLLGELRGRRAELVAAWGEEWCDRATEMVEVELASVPIRAFREDRYDLSVKLREDVMKELADRRLEGLEGGTLINVGANHAQKEYLRGTEQEWLGDYLVHKSTAVGGSVIVLEVTPARIMSAGEGGVTEFDLRASPENELFRLMNETWPDQIVFLPLDDPIFQTGAVPMNSEGEIYVGSPKRHYDVSVLLPLARRIPIR